LEVTYRDLASEAINHFSGATLAALGTPAELRDAAQQHEADLSASTLAEFLAADAVVLGAPMYNFTIPSQLKAWIDRIAVARARPSATPKPARKACAATRKSSSSPRPAACMLARQPAWPTRNT
jgi:FMN-dependent NADH-azoreductase